MMFSFLDSQNIAWDTQTIKISHFDQKLWNKLDSFIFGGGLFENIQYGHHQELLPLNIPSKIDRHDLLWS